MASVTRTSGKQKDSPREGALRADQLIDRQLGRVRRQIRLADLAAGCMTLAAGVLAYLLGVAVVDHWLFGLGVAGRLVALLMLVGGVAAYFITRILPTLIRPINPAFAAQTIERGEPALKNSLLNYLLLRRERAALHKIVFEALQYRAAHDVSRVEVEHTVDRSSMIHAGYLLAAIMAVGAVYKIASPKDPLQTVQRIVTPLADIARPSRVSIEAVEPGDTELYHGQSARVSAIVRGVRAQEPVRLIYSSADGQIVDRELLMSPDSTGLRHEALLPDAGGLQQDVRYRLEAGDGVTREFQIRVVAAPVISVASIEYDFPAYTGRPREVVPKEGDIRAVEGTRVTVRAVANQPIRTATLEIAPSAAPGPPNAQPTPAPERAPMTSDAAQAHRTFLLELDQRGKPRRETYSVSFVNSHGVPSVAPVVHRFEVIPDLAPEIEFLAPTRDRVEVPLRGELKVEVRAIDPDYGLRRVTLHAVQGGTHVLERSLLPAGEPSGQVVATVNFRPLDFALNVGDEVTIWASADDNRTAYGSDTPEPNSARTRDLRLVVIADPPPRPRGGPESAASPSGAGQPRGAGPRDSAARQPDDQKSAPRQPGADPSGGSAADAAGSQPKSQGATEKSKGKQPGNSRQDRDKSPPKPGGNQGTEKEKPQSPDQSSQSGAKGAETGKKSGSRDQQGKEGAAPNNAPPQPGQGGADAAASSESASGSEGQDPRGGAGAGEQAPADGRGATSENAAGGPSPSDRTGSSRPGSPETRTEPLHDGEVFEKALEHLKRQSGESSRGTSQGESAQERQPSEDGQRDAADTSAEPQSAPGKTSPPGSPPQAADPQPRRDGRNQGAGDQRAGAPGEGGKSARGGLERPERDKDAPKKPEAKSAKEAGRKDPGLSDNGESGAGQNSKDPTGSGSIEQIGGDPVLNRDRPKSLTPDSQTPQEQGDPATTESDRQSDSQGGQSGDKSGGGKKGSGQGANQPGNDSAGQNSSSDDGAGKSSESGQGETSAAAGSKKPAGGPTGKSGNQPGAGTGTQPAPKGGQAGDGRPAGSPPPPGPTPAQPGSAGGQGQPGGKGSPQRGGLPGDAAPGTPPQAAEVPPGDAANLEYSRKATDMVLDHLRHQADNPDRKLLDELGWTPAEMRAFLDRWQKLKQAAREDEHARRELDESLRSLGLSPAPDTRRTGGTRTDELRGLGESGAKSDPPSAYQDQFRAFKKGAARGRPDGSAR